MLQTQTLLKDKPYEFIPFLTPCKQIHYHEQPVRETCIYNGKWRLKIIVKSPLHIGGGLQEYNNSGNVIKKQMRRNGNVIVPGSSLKGAVRSVAEAVSYSCAVQAPDKSLRSVLPEKYRQPCTSADKLCMACYIFGMMSEKESFKGRVQFGEFVMKSGTLIKENIPALKSPFQNQPQKPDKFRGLKDCNYGNERFYYCKACKNGDCKNCTKENYEQNIKNAGKNREMEFRGRKFYHTGKEMILPNGEKNCYEMIASGSMLEGEITFQNLRAEEGKLLAYALDIGHYFCMKLGYGKPLGYGKVEIDLLSAESMAGRYLTVAKMDKKLAEKWAQEYRTEHTDSISSAIEELERIMQP